MSSPHERETFLLPTGCSDLVDAIRLKERRAARRAEARRVSRTRVADAFARWSTWAERHTDAKSIDVLDPALGEFFDFAALLTSHQKSELESRIATHPLGVQMYEQIMKRLFTPPPA
jgi:hypothetical protein